MRNASIIPGLLLAALLGATAAAADDAFLLRPRGPAAASGETLDAA
jgi:hypothetical protein